VATGTRIESVIFTSAQATAAASSAMVGRLFVSDNAGANWRIVREVALPTLTPSNTVIGQTQPMTFPGGFFLPLGCRLAATISVYAGAQDQYDVIIYPAGDF